jgi:hypothetical protein
MRVCTVIGLYWPFIAGAEVFCQRVAEYMAGRGHEVHVVSRLDAPPGYNLPEPLPPYSVINDVQVHRVRCLTIPYLQTMALIGPIRRKAIALHREQRFDLVHAHIFPGLVIGAQLKRRTGVPLLATVQGGDLADYPELRVANGLLKPMIRSALRRAQCVHAVSHSLAERVRSFGQNEVEVVPNGVDLEMFRPRERAALRAEMGYRPDEKIVISISRFTPKNGLDVLIRAMAEARRRGVEARLVLAGTGHREAELRRLAGGLGLGERVQFLGYVRHEDTPRYYAMSDVFVRPSLAEGFGISFIEAMACGTAVIGTPVGGITDIIEDGKNGLFAPAGDVSGLAERIERVLSRDLLRHQLTAGGLRTVREKFAWGAVLRRMEAIYGRVAWAGV